MKCIEKLGGLKNFKNYLISKGYNSQAIQMMITRRKVSSKAAILIISDHKYIDFDPSDFCESREDNA